MTSLYSLPCKRRVWLTLLLISSLLGWSQQIGSIYQPSPDSILDPNKDGWISASGGAIDTSVVIDESFDFEYPMIPMFHLSIEPPADLMTGNDCGKSEIVDNPGYPMSAGYWYLGDQDGFPGNGDEFVMYRIRIARNVNGAYGFSFLIDTDNRIGFTGPTADPNAVTGNPGFEIEIIYGTAGQGLVSIMDVDGTTTGTTLSSYPGSTHSQRSHAGYTNCPLSDPVFLDFYVPFDSIGINPNDSIRMIFATSSSANSALGGSASDIGGVNDNLYNDPDSIFIAITDSTPVFTLGGCGWAIAEQGSQVSCHGDSDGWAWVDVWGGAPPTSYLWSTGATTDTVYGLSAGTYEIYITSGGGCTDTVSVTVTEPDSLAAQIDIVDSIQCFGDLNGRLAGYATGGTPPYSFSWNTGAIHDTLDNMGAGTYSLTVTDANGCVDSVTIQLTQPSSALAVALNSQTQILCFGDSSGTIDLSITGGTPPYNVNWIDGSTDSARTGLTAGTYSVIVTDANGCADSLEITLTQPTQAVGGLTIAESPVSCFGGSDGVGVVVASGGTSPYTYLWSSGETADTATGLSAGTHTVIVTDSVGCSDTLSLMITQPDSALSASAIMTSAVSCFGGSDGVATVQISGGTVPYAILWNTGDTTNSITAPAGTYSVVVTDAGGCVDSASITITEPTSALTVSITDSTDVLCFGDANGSATATASGGTPPYDFQWSNGAADSANVGLSGGTYTVIVTDANGCEDSATVTLSEPSAALVANANLINAILCNGDSDGSVYLDISGGSTPYAILWNTGSTSDTITGLPAGTYTATVTDANGCSDTAQIILDEPTALNVSGSVDANVLCFGDSTGEATVNVTGGVSPYSYAWSAGQTTASVNNLTAGSHTVVVTDANGCQDSIDVTITQPVSALTAGTTSTVGVTCRGDIDGSASASASGGTPPYSYAWSNGMTGSNIFGLAGGDYILTVTDANGCTAIDTVNIFEAPFELLVGAADGNAITCAGGNDGMAYASATGGAPPYSFSWSNGMTGDTITGISAGSYIVTVTDSMGCTDTNLVVVSEPDPLVQNLNSTNVTCFGANDGTVTANPTDGVPPYNYLWNTGSTAQSITGLSAGTYWVQVTDANGCAEADTAVITQPSMPLAAIISKTDVNCFGGSDGTAEAIGSGGVTPYTYAWSNGQTGQMATGLAPGGYYVIMTDANGCQDSAYVTITEPASALSASAAIVSAPTCAGFLNGSAYGSATSGTPPYTYSWNNGVNNDTVTGLGGGQIVLTVTDSNGCQAFDTLNMPQPSADLEVSASVIGAISCNGSSDGILYGTATGGTAPYTISWSTGHVGDTLSGVSAGTYLVYVVDSNGCSSTGTITIGEPDSLVSSTSLVNNVSCFGGSDGSASASALGGTAPYSFAWSNGQTSATATGLTAGDHYVTVTDSNGCQVVDTVSITEPATAVAASAQMDTSVSCVGGSDGEATASVTGGTAPYTYLWSNGQTTATATGLAAGTHTFIVTDSLGCQDSASVVITEPAMATDVNAVQIHGISCVGSSDGWATVSGSGGTPPYTYAWSNGQSGDSAFGLSQATYVVTVTDARGCTDTANISIPGPSAPLTATAIDAYTITCFEASDGTVYVVASGGWAPYTYVWNTGSSDDTVTGLAAGTYNVTITDSMGCVIVESVTITEPTQVTGTVTLVRNVSCLGGSDGSAVAVGSGGTPPYTYLWSNGETSDTAIALTAGNHSVTVTDSNGCAATAQVSISEPSTAVSGGASVLTQVLCFGDSSATARATASGGTAPYTYLWSDGQTTRTASGFWAGTHTVVVTDANGCTDSASIVVTQPASAVDASASMLSSVSCFGGNDGTATASASGGTAPYTYQWSTGGSGATATGLSAQWYTVTVTDANGCSDTARVRIQEPSAPVSVSGVVVNDVTCFGGTYGIAWANATGGTPPYAYSWSDGQITDTAIGLTAGSYAVLVTDSLGCQDLVSVVISQPATDVFVSATALTTTSCFDGADGTATAWMTNGLPPYTYLWSDGQTTDTAVGLAPGVYSVSITDSLGCDATASVTISGPPQNIMLTMTLLSQVSCIGGADASANVFAQGGTAPYTYLWSNGETSATATALAAGTHTVIVTDSLGCLDSAFVTIGEPASAVDASASVLFPVNCFGGSDGYATASATGGTPPYTYTWSDGQTGNTAWGLDTGLYIVTVMDANGCSDTAHVTMTQPDSAVSISVQVLNNVRCLGGFDGQALASAMGGTPPYSFDWDHGPSVPLASGLVAGRYTVTVTDDNGCQDSMSVIITQPASALTLFAGQASAVNCFGGNDGVGYAAASGGDGPYTYTWSNGMMGDTVQGLIAGSYTVTVADSNGCQVTANLSITQPASALAASAFVNSNVSCFGGSNGSATAAGTGGTAPYSYAWSNGQITATATGLAAGSHTVVVTDANGCQDSASVIITQPATSISVSASVMNQVSCYLGSDANALVSYSGGTAPYTVLWSTGAAIDTIVNIPAGTYSVTVTDANGCTATDSVIITQPASAVDANASVIANVTCYGVPSGSATVTATGGTAPYTYSWSNGANTPTINTLSAGQYVVTITDANGCFDMDSVVITQPASPLNAVLVSNTNVDCFGNNTGSAQASVSGGTSPYTYAWSNGAVTSNISNVAAGVYSLTVTDANGCIDTLSVTITQPSAALISSSTVIQNVSCFGGVDGSAFVSYTGGTAPYSVSWSNGATSDSISNLNAGTYTVTITDANGCTTTQSVVITEPSSALAASAVVNQNVNCFGGNTGSATATASGGTSPYTYVWSNGATGANLNGVTAGTYSVTITDANGCTETATVTITQPAAALTVGVLSSGNVDCFGSTTGFANVGASGGTTPYTYVWSNGTAGASLNNVGAGTYTVTVADANGCTATTSITLTQPASALASSATIVSQVACFGGATGEAYVSYSGGTAPYSVLWSTGQTADTLVNMTAGSYSVTITDANGCTSSQTVVITQPASALSLSAVVSNHVLCFGTNSGAGAANVSGGTSPYTYNWSNGATGANISGLAPGSYSVTVTDANGCVVSGSIIINGPSSALTASAGVLSHVDCFGVSTGSASSMAAGGTAPYSYAWSNGATTSNVRGLPAGTHTVTITDANGCTATASITINQPTSGIAVSTGAITNVNCFGGNDGSATIRVIGGTAPYNYAWSNGATTANLTNVATGTYSVTVIDANGCSATHSVTIGGPVSGLSITKTATAHVNCFNGLDGFASISVSGGTSPYSVTWNNGQTGNSASNLAAGQYVATVTDANGCSDTVVFNINQPSSGLSAANGFIQNVTCFGGNDGRAYVAISGGTAPYSVLWSNGATSDTLNSVQAGSYTVIVTDANGCTDSTTVVITQPSSAVTASIQIIQNIYCKGDASGAAFVAYTGGTPPYQVTWSTGATGDSISNVPAGSYTATITDANGCSVSISNDITEPNFDLTAATNMLNPVRCYGESDGVAAVSLFGGTPPYNVVWSTGATGDTVAGLPVGRYGVAITDAMGCYKTDSVDILGPNQDLGAIQDVIMVNCGGANSGGADITPFGGTPPYVVSWSHGQSGMNISGLGVGKYSYVVTDANGCRVGDTVEVVENEPIETGISVDFASCPTSNDGYVELDVTGGTPPYTFLFDGEQFSGIKDDIRPGSHELTIADALGCDSTFYIYVGVDQERDYLHIPNAFTPNEDRINESYKIVGSECIGPSRFQIFDRWGNLVFSSHDPFNEFWDGTRADGTKVKEDTYVWVFTSAECEKRGWVTVIH